MDGSAPLTHTCTSLYRYNYGETKIFNCLLRTIRCRTRSCLTIRGRPCPLFPIAAVCGLGTFWTLLFTILQRYDVDPQDYGIPPVAVSVLGGTVGFLIVYRTGESAKRWWDGRTHFGSAVAFSVDLVRNSTTAIISNKQLANCIALYALAVVVCLKVQTTRRHPVSSRSFY